MREGKSKKSIQMRYRPRRRNQFISDNLFAGLLGLVLVGFGLWQWSGFDPKKMLIIIVILLLTLIVMGVVAVIFWEHRKSRRLLSLQKSEVEKMDGIAFEYYLGDLLKKDGYTSVKVTPQQGDYGADLFAQKNGVSYAIQAKRYSDHNLVGVAAIQAISSAREFYDKDVAMVITTGHFSEAARKMAKKNRVILIDKNKLSALIDRYQT